MPELSCSASLQSSAARMSFRSAAKTDPMGVRVNAQIVSGRVCDVCMPGKESCGAGGSGSTPMFHILFHVAVLSTFDPRQKQACARLYHANRYIGGVFAIYLFTMY